MPKEWISFHTCTPSSRVEREVEMNFQEPVAQGQSSKKETADVRWGQSSESVKGDSKARWKVANVTTELS